MRAPLGVLLTMLLPPCRLRSMCMPFLSIERIFPSGRMLALAPSFVVITLPGGSPGFLEPPISVRLLFGSLAGVFVSGPSGGLAGSGWVGLVIFGFWGGAGVAGVWW